MTASPTFELVAPSAFAPKSRVIAWLNSERPSQLVSAGKSSDQVAVPFDAGTPVAIRIRTSRVQPVMPITVRSIGAGNLSTPRIMDVELARAGRLVMSTERVWPRCGCSSGRGRCRVASIC